MILSKYYRDYNGPDLVVAELWLNEDDKETFIDYMKVFYGENNTKILFFFVKIVSGKNNKKNN